MDYFEIGSAPPSETPAQVGDPGYAEQAKEECTALIEMIRRTVGPEPPGAQLDIQTNPHDFGEYHEVVVRYDRQEGLDYALKVEAELPSTWDDVARAKLALKAGE